MAAHRFLSPLGLLLLLLALLPVGGVAAAEPAPQSADQPLLVLNYHDIRDDVAPHGDADQFATSTQNFIAHLDWLAAQGYHPVSLQQVIDASAGRAKLPSKPVLLTFDDGLRSVYTKVFPLLRAYKYPALVAVITAWVDLPQGQTVQFSRPMGREDFVTWEQLREMQDSGLVEIASHTDDMHHGLLANPQGNQRPAAVSLRYDAATGRYEDEAAYAARVRADLAGSRDKIAKHLGRAPRSVVWPYGAENGIANGIATDLGMGVTFDLEGRTTLLDHGLEGLARLLITNNPPASDLAVDLRRDMRLDGIRAVQVDLDNVYDADPQQQSRNIDALIERVKQIGPNYVFLQAFADPDGNGSADALYFPNSHLPMRADLFNFVAWQLQTRAGAQVYAWLPVLGFEPRDAGKRRELGIANADPKDVYRLDFTKPEARAMIEGIYGELAASSNFQGLLFHDDAFLRDNELPALGGDPGKRTQALIDFTLDLKRASEHWRSKLKTVRNLYARTLVDPVSEAWFAQRLDAFNRHYDYTALMAMPWLEGSGHKPWTWLRNLAKAVGEHDPKFDKTIFELQTLDWSSRKPIADKTLIEQSRMLRAMGVRHLAWYPDDFIANRPRLEAAREVISSRGFPYPLRK
ncbi:poly-beta-1,6-N-acetyl-D-glucosamine N-deacetylase PgaB [Luteimonas aquatica]|uniref:poly-beta-1,6-N-acetyl-D-glucosamine N-deacetylase PgaB n=1 Tax=Luteimonas aquatica TaxID=450364 RepID=UPI001F59F69A|nr:poly-beta-1,6-N-acetyl-D-glucosamine N-deacetylase PgaB [Luteimonas aquatica]